MEGNIYSDADVTDKYDNEKRLAMFAKDHNIFGFLLLKNHILKGNRACRYRRDKRSRRNGWRLE